MATGKPMMFLRTAQTEQRIEDLEKEVARILTHLKLNEPTQSDEEWEKAEPVKPPSKIAQRIAKAKG